MELSEKIANAESERTTRLDKLDRIEEQISRLSREVEELNRVISKKTFQIDEIGSSRPRLDKSIPEKRERLLAMEGESLSFKEQLGLLEGEIRVSEETLADVQQKIDEIGGRAEGLGDSRAEQKGGCCAVWRSSVCKRG